MWTWTLAIHLLTPAQADVRPLVQDLVTNRAELETLGRELEGMQKEKQSELDSWLQKKQELETALQKEKLRRLQIDEKIARLQAAVRGDGKRDPGASAEVARMIDQARSWVESSLPFRRETRLETLNSLRSRAEAGMESPEMLLSELWSFYESELKMAGESEYRILDRAELARLGWVAMFSRAPGGTVQRTAYADGKWSTQALSGDEEKEALRLMDNMKLRKKSGYYRLSLPAVKEVL